MITSQGKSPVTYLSGGRYGWVCEDVCWFDVNLFFICLFCFVSFCCCFCLCVCVCSTVLKDLVLIPVHTKPDDSLKELDELYEVFMAVKKKWHTDVSLQAM